MHPFNVELMQGTLDIEKFRFYIFQDSLYLNSFGKALAITAGRADNSMMNDFLKFASDSILVEKLLHENYFKLFKLNTHDYQQSPACFMYSNYLLNICSLCSFEEAVAALLPCFWIYREVGNDISKKAERTNPYINWIDTYSGKEFTDAVDRMLSITDELASSASEKLLGKMEEKYIRAVKLEYLFWDSAYRMEEWGI